MLDALADELAEHDDALVLGDGQSLVAAALRGRGVCIEAVRGDWPSVQLPVRYSVVVVEPPDRVDDAAAIVHCAAQHVGPGGDIVVLGVGGIDAADRFDLTERSRITVDGSDIAVLRRTHRTTIHDKVFAARSRIARVAHTNWRTVWSPTPHRSWSTPAPQPTVPASV